MGNGARGAGADRAGGMAERELFNEALEYDRRKSDYQRAQTCARPGERAGKLLPPCADACRCWRRDDAWISRMPAAGAGIKPEW
jgi:hypothetical protein